MKTTNYELDMMLPMQLGKEALFNESQRFFDMFCNFAIQSAIDQLPESPAGGERYIKSVGPDAGYIFFWDNNSFSWRKFKPKEGMIFYLIEEENFFLFINDSWKIILPGGQGSPKIQQEGSKKFNPISGIYEIVESGIYYLYMEADCLLEIVKNADSKPGKSSALKLVIKQNIKEYCKLSWPEYILWENKTPHEMSETAGAMDLIEIIPLPETEHFIGRVLAKNYQY